MALKEIPQENRRAWLGHWHSVIDAELGPDSSFDFEVAFKDPYGDFRMHFATWDLSDEALCRCFEVLPLGTEMADRAIEMRSLYRADATSISEDAAVDLFQKGLDAFSRFTDDANLMKSIRVKHVSSEELNIEAGYADRVAVLFESVNWAIPPAHCEASSFLTETLYRLAYSYDVVDYIEWPLFPDPRSIDPHRRFSTLALTGTYFPLLDEDGPVLFVTSDKSA